VGEIGSRDIADRKGALQRVGVKINRNLMHFPLARDVRTKAVWSQCSETGGWMADLPGEGRKTHRIRLILPANTLAQARRCPSALDMNVLFQLLSESQRHDRTRPMEFASFADFLRRLHLTERNRERARLQSSLVYWMDLSIQWSHWYQHGEHVQLTLPPPIADAAIDGNRVTITLHTDWFRFARAHGYYEWLPSLPPRAAAQNLVLLVLTQHLTHENLDSADPDGYYFDLTAQKTKPMDRWWLARKIGLLHKQRNRVLDRASIEAAEWFSDNGGKLKLVAAATDEDPQSRQIGFRYAKPRVPRRKSSMGRSHGPLKLFHRETGRPQHTASRDQDNDLVLHSWFALIEKEARGKW
jgi:hypothetical protein